ncbi:MAG: T9SS C-terminal target domain-containing protein [Saprospirales bacterium]|nr:MAG: T9SS C-terminal target domain-containing protein [Saprospirales bacterium]
MRVFLILTVLIPVLCTPKDSVATEIILRWQEEVNSFNETYPEYKYQAPLIRIIGIDITNLDSLHHLWSCWGIQIEGTMAQSLDITGLRNLEVTGAHGFSIKRNQEENIVLPVFKDLRSVEGPFVINHSRIGNIQGVFPKLRNVASISIRSNNFLQINFLESLAFVGGDFHIIDNLNLFQISMPSLELIEGRMTISGSPVLQSISVSENFSIIAGELILNQLPRLEDMSFTNSLEMIGKDLRIIHTGLERLSIGDVEIIRNIFVSNNENLIDLSGLESLSYVFGDIEIRSNSNLLSIEGMDNWMNLIGQRVFLTNNPELNFCNTDFICAHLQTNRYFEAFGNGPNCSSPQIIQEQCVVSSERSLESKNTIIFPNPSTGYLRVELPGHGMHLVKVYSSEGVPLKMTKSQHPFEMDLSDLPAGFYLLKIKGEIHVATHPFILHP